MENPDSLLDQSFFEECRRKIAKIKRTDLFSYQHFLDKFYEDLDKFSPELDDSMKEMEKASCCVIL